MATADGAACEDSAADCGPRLVRPWAASSACSDSMAPWPRDTCWEMATPNEGSVTTPEIVSGRR